tara:strand:+ start:157 stop:1101 length:945 start_codon:yes stop_codon:yes gene_type:complete
LTFFSVIVPCFNVEDTIIQTISSVQNQTFKSFEIIAIDDGSTDNTLKILKLYDNDPTFRIISQNNKGLGYARNIGIRNAKGDFVCLLDADDLWKYNRLQKIYNCINSFNPELISNDEIIYDENKKISYLINKPPKNFRSLLLGGNTLSPSAMTIKKSIFDSIGYFIEDRELSGLEDWDYWLRVYKNGKIIHYINEPLGVYRRDIQNMSKENDFFKKVLKIYNLHSQKLITQGKLTKFDYQIGKSFIEIRVLIKNRIFKNNIIFDTFKIKKTLLHLFISKLIWTLIFKFIYRQISIKIKSLLKKKELKWIVTELL